MGKSKLYLTHDDRDAPVTHEEFAEADFEEPWQYERAGGRLVVMTPPSYEHHVIAEWFRNHLGAYELNHPETVEHVFQEGWTAIDPETDRRPDIQVFLTSNPDDRQFPQRVPDIVFEIVSAGPYNRQRDYEEKRGDYERFGVREYVIVDRFEHKVTVLRLGDEGYGETVLGPDDVYTSPLLPALEIPLTGVI